MTPTLPNIVLVPVRGAVPAWRGEADAARWLAACEHVAQTGGRLAALWASDERGQGPGYRVSALLVVHEGLVCLELRVPESEPTYPDLAALFPAAGRMQRAAFDLVGVRALRPEGDVPDPRPWLRHGAWPEDVFPLRDDFDATGAYPVEQDRYPFVRVDGEGVHEIPV